MQIIGRLTRDAQINTLPSEKQVVNFSVAVNDSYRNKLGEQVKQTSFFDCAYWVTTNLAKILTKGTVVELTGRVQARAWINKDGEAKAALSFHTAKITLHGGGQKNETTAGGTETTPAAAAQKGKRKTKSEDKDDLPF